MADPVRPFEDLRATGLLWLINRVVLALALHHDQNGRAIGWSLAGDGTEPWTFSANEDPEFRAVERLFKGAWRRA